MKFLLLLAMLVAPTLASADVLIRNCDTPTAAGCAVAPIWVKPASAVNVQVQRAGAPFVALADVLPTERIAACYDIAITAGSAAKCAVNVPGRTDLWELKSVLYPAPAPAVAGSLLLLVDASNPRWDSQAALATNLLADLYVRIYGGEQGKAKTLLDAAPWASSLKFRRESTSTALFCFAATLALDTDGDKLPDVESSPTTAEWCGTYASPPPILHLLPPAGITGQSPAP